MKISVGNSRTSRAWKIRELSWDEFAAKCSETIRTAETVQEYRKLPKGQQDTIKDVGGFVGGELRNGIRKKDCIINRSLLTLDADYADEDFWEQIEMFFDFRCLIYSTHKHTPEKPRLRLIIPLSRPVTPDEYTAIARRIAADIGIEQFDDTTYQPHRLMYWPSTSSDGEFVFKIRDGTDIDADATLSRYKDWHDTSEYPVSSRQKKIVSHAIKKQADPLEKSGIVGAFCRAYPIPEVNEPVMLGRYGVSYVFDTTPKSNSTNPVTSKGIYTAISKCVTKEGKQTIKIPYSATENDTPLTLESNKGIGCYIGLKPFTEDTGYYGVTDEGDPVYYLDENGTDKILNFRDVNVTVDNIYAHGEGKSDNAAHEIASQATITAAVDDNSAELIAEWNDHKFALAAGDASHIEGSNCLALGKNSHAEGNGTIAEKSSAHAEGTGSHAKGKYSHAGGLETTASGNEAFAHGYRVRATGNGSVALGYNSDDFTDNNASNFATIAIGHDTKASAYCSAAIGDHANALNDNAIAIGNGVRTAGNSQTVLGKYNKEDGGKLLIVGNGGSGSSRSNAYTLDWSGNAWYAGTVEATGIILKSSTAGSTKRFRITVDDSGTLSAELVE